MDEPAGRFERTSDGQWMLTTSDGQVFVGASMQEVLAVAVPDAPADLLEHLVARDSGEWACPLPDEA